MIRFGMLGAARIAPDALIKPCKADPRAAIHALAARDRARAEKMADRAKIPEVMQTYQEVVEHPECDAVYIPLPISGHHEWTLKALEAGKHVLCEKALACNAREAEEMAALARARGLVLMEAFHYRYHPVFERAKEILESGTIGTIRAIRAEFSVPVRIPEDDIRMRYETGGGVTMDIGTYPLSWVRHLLDEEPQEVTAVAEEGPPDVDVRLTAQMTFESGVVAEATGDMTGRSSGGKPALVAEIAVQGEDGVVMVKNPLAPQHGHAIEITVGGETRTETSSRRPTYSYQLDAFVDAIEKGAPLHTDGEDGIAQMRLIDRCYEAAGMRVRGTSPHDPE